MRIGIISDIHGYPVQFKKAISLLSGCSMILCAGDILYHGPRNPILEGYDPLSLAKAFKEVKIPMLTARGNCDAEVDIMVLDYPLIPGAVVYEASSTRFVLLHGHDVDDSKLMQIAKSLGGHIIVTGHTHIRKCVKNDDIIFLNPGSMSVPKGDEIPTIAIFEDGEVSFLNVNTGDTIEKIHL